MGIIALLLLVGFIVCVITTIVLQITRKNGDSTIISSITISLYGAYILLSAFYPYEGVDVGLDVIGICYMVGITVTIGWKLLLNKKDILIWIIAGGVVSVYAIGAHLYRYRASSIMDNALDFIVLFTVGIFILTILAIVKRNSVTPTLIRTLIISFILETILFCIVPPLEILTMISSIIVMALIGVIPGGILIFLYKKVYQNKEDIYTIGDDI